MFKIISQRSNLLSSQLGKQLRRYYQVAVCNELGKPLTIEDRDSPKLGSGEVRVGVHSAGINFSDLLTVQGLYQERPPLPFVAGAEFAGEVLEVGDEVKNYSKGDHVLGMKLTMGAFAEEVVANEMELWHVPQSIVFDEAAALACSYGTAWLGLNRRAQVQEGETVLVTAAAGAFGLATVDLAANVIGAKVIGAAGGAEKCKQVEKAGATKCIDYTKDNIKEQVKELTNGNGVNVAFDAVGGDVFKQCLSSLAFEGRLMVIGFAGGNIPKIPANLLLVKNVTIHGFYWGQHAMRDYPAFRKSVDDVIELADERRIHPHFDNTFPLEKVNEAMQSIITRKSVGKVIVKLQNF